MLTCLAVWSDTQFHSMTDTVWCPNG